MVLAASAAAEALRHRPHAGLERLEPLARALERQAEGRRVGARDVVVHLPVEHGQLRQELRLGVVDGRVVGRERVDAGAQRVEARGIGAGRGGTLLEPREPPIEPA